MNIQIGREAAGALLSVVSERGADLDCRAGLAGANLNGVNPGGRREDLYRYFDVEDCDSGGALYRSQYR